MTIQQIADRLVVLCRQRQFRQAQEELYAADANSLKPDNGAFRTTYGLAALQAEGTAFWSRVETLHELTVSEPLVAAIYFSLVMRLDMTLPGVGRRVVDEICVYRVSDERIVQEQFFF